MAKTQCFANSISVYNQLMPFMFYSRHMSVLRTCICHS